MMTLRTINQGKSLFHSFQKQNSKLRSYKYNREKERISSHYIHYQNRHRSNHAAPGTPRPSFFVEIQIERRHTRATSSI